MHVNVQVNNADLCINTAHLSSSKGRVRNNELELCYLSCVLDVIRICGGKASYAMQIKGIVLAKMEMMSFTYLV